MSLQRQVGNRAVASLVSGAPGGTTSRPVLPIQRWFWNRKKKSKISAPTNARKMTFEQQKGILSNAQLIKQQERQQAKGARGPFSDEAAEGVGRMVSEADLEAEREPKRKMALEQGSGPGIDDESAEGVGEMIGRADLEAEREPKRKMALEQGTGRGIDDESLDGLGGLMYPQTVTLGTERVVVQDLGEELEALQIMNTLQSQFGVTLSSPASIQAIKTQYNQVNPDTLNALETNVWHMKELRAVLQAVTRFAPILGTKRDSSSLSGRAQGVTTIGRVRQQVDANYFAAPMIQGVMGEYMNQTNNATLFDTQTDLVDDRYQNPATGRADNATTIEANAVHEMSHGLVEPIEKPNWVRALSFWQDANTPSGDLTAEAPPTQYGRTNAGEDLAESVAIFFTNRDRLRSLCPLREAFLARMVASWTPPQRQQPITGAQNARGNGA